MSDPGRLKEFPDITALLPQAAGNGEQPAAADPTLAGLDAMTDFALDDGRAESLCVVYNPRPECPDQSVNRVE
ncbi:hypothetical protein H6G65_12630 [Microcystis elabens FACHB-917]|nr:hypothetical protein [Microcystis elabens FACHB-917]